VFKTDQLLGRDFSFATAHCYHLVRDFHLDNFGMEMTNYACPDNWWDKGGDLFMENYYKEGFVPFRGHPREVKPGMVSLMAILSPVANHCGILMPGDQILHHLVGQKSCIENYNRPIFRNGQVAVMMHPSIDYDALIASSAVDAMELLPPSLRRAIEEARQQAEQGSLDV
jgi:cell wall-associated NlpC family hydrolase